MEEVIPYTPPGPAPPPNTFFPYPAAALAPQDDFARSQELEVIDTGGACQPAYASWGRRAGALFVDGSLFGLVLLPLLAVFGVFAASLGIDLGAFASLGMPLLAIIAWAGYTLGTMTRIGAYAGQTLGKQVMGIRVVRTDGERLSSKNILVRESLAKGVLDMTSLGILVNYLWPLWDPERQALHDKVAKTIVVEAHVPSAAPTLLAAAPTTSTSLESSQAVEAFFDDFPVAPEAMPQPRSQVDSKERYYPPHHI